MRLILCRDRRLLWNHLSPRVVTIDATVLKKVALCVSYSKILVSTRGMCASSDYLYNTTEWIGA